MVFSFGRRISSPRRILFVRPAHPIILPQSLQPAGTSHRSTAISSLQSICLRAHSLPIHQFGVGPFGRRIPHRAATNLALFHLAGAFPADLVSSFASAFAANPPIWCCSIWLAHPLTAPPLPILAVASPRCATFAYLGWHIPSPIFRRRIPLPLPCHHCSFWPAHPLAVPPLPT